MLFPPSFVFQSTKLFLTSTFSTQKRLFHFTKYNMGIDTIIRYEKEHNQENELLPMASPTPEPESLNADDPYPFKLNRSSTLQDFLKSNKTTMDNLKKHNPEVMHLSGHGQSPHTLWIGCSDSRVNECTALGCLPGEIFTLRNIANVISFQDLSSTSSLQFAIDFLKVKRIIVCGHTDCGGIWGSLSSKRLGGVLDSWLTPVRQVRLNHLKELNDIKDPFEKCKKLSELNVINSIKQITTHPSFVAAHNNGELEIYGLMYDVKTGYLHELELPAQELDDLYHVFQLSENGAEDDYSPH